MSGRQTVRDADTGLQTCVHVGDLKELAERLRASDDSCMYFGCWDGPECDGCQAYESPYDCSGAMAHDAADRIDSAITRGVFSAGDNDDPASYAAKAVAWVASHGGLDEVAKLPYLLNESRAHSKAVEEKCRRVEKQLRFAEEKCAERRAGAKWLNGHGGLEAVKAEWAHMRGRAKLADEVAVRLGVDPLTDDPIDGEVHEALDGLQESGGPDADRFTIRHDAIEALEWVEEHGGLKALREELPVLAYRASLVGDVYDALDIDPGEPHAAVLLSREVKRIREDHDALLWMDEHGGLGQVKMDCAMGDGFADLADRVAAKLGVDVEGLDAQDSEPVIMDAIDRRLVPDGMEWLLEVWPRWSNGEYCKFGDWWMSEKYGERKPQQLRKLAIYSPEQLREWGQDDGDHFGYEWDYMRPSDTTYRPDKVEPPAPKVLDADGEEIRKGDTLYRKSDGKAVKVAEVGEKTFTDSDGYVRPGDGYTHRAPVLAADGKPLHEREHVWHAETGTELVVKRLPKPGEYQSVVVFAPPASHLTSFDPGRLTHERPDSWERLEKDMRCLTQRYLGPEPDITRDFIDIVRRARALAERGL